MPCKPYLRFLAGSIVFAAGIFALFAGLPMLWISGNPRGQNNAVATVSAASFRPALAPEAIASAFGQKLATRVEIASSLPLPTSLAGTSVRVNGTLAQLFYVSPGQINYLIPTGTPAGDRPVSVTSGDGTVSTGTVSVGKVAPGIFTANAGGQGLPAAVLLRLPPGGQPSFESVNQPLIFKQAGERLFLILYLCGVRQAGAGKVKALILGNELPTEFAAAPGFVGLDQANVELPDYLSGRGRINLQIKAEDVLSNAVEIQMGGTDLRTTPTTTVTSSANPAVVGQEISYTVRVAAAGNSRIPSGNLMLTENGAMIGKKPLDAGGQAVFTYLLTATGARTIAAGYEGDNYFKESSGALAGPQNVNKAQAAISLSSASNPASLAQTVTLTATIRAVAPSTFTPTGILQFKENNAPLGAPITLINGRADFSINNLALGSRNLTAEYYGSPNFQPVASTAYSQVINTAPLQIRGITRATPVYAGEEITISGSGFTANLADHEVKFAPDDRFKDPASGVLNAQEATGKVIAAAGTQLRVLVPFDAASGKIKVRVGDREIESAETVEIGTSVSGVVHQFKDGVFTGVADLPVTLDPSKPPTKTNSSGVFIIKGATPAARANVLIGANNSLGYPTVPVSTRVLGSRDNQLSSEKNPILVEAKPGGASLTSPITANTPINETLRASAEPGKSAVIITSGQVTFDTNNSTVTCPGASGCQLALAVFDPGRTPTNLPAGRFSSTIAQITPFGATLAPGGKLTFPNSDNIPLGTPVRVFRYDQTSSSQTFGQFADIGAATISADGTKIETAANAVTQAGYYFVSRQWPTATIIGLVTDAEGRAVRRAVVSARGQAVFTGNNGGFVLANVPVITPDGTNDQLTIEIAFVRADGTVARTARSITGLRANESRTIEGDFILPRAATNRAPQIIAPSSLIVNEGETRDFNFLAIDPDGNAVSLSLSGAPFATLAGNGNPYTLRLAPGANTANNHTLSLIATDSPTEGPRLTALQSIEVIVQRAGNSAPTANYQAVTTNEDTPLTFALSATSSGGGGLIYTVVGFPSHGSFRVSPPNVTYTPDANFNGFDNLSFKVSNSSGESNVATVFIAVNPVNDAPTLTATTSTSFSVNAGETVKIDLTAMDVDAEQTLTFTVTGLPPGASFATTGNNAQINWTPSFLQVGAYTLTVAARDNGTPPLASAIQTATVNVVAKWAQTSGPAGGTIQALFQNGSTSYAGTCDGVYRSTNGSASWTRISKGLPVAGCVNALVANSTALLAAVRAVDSQGTPIDRIYRSVDNGANWTAAFNTEALTFARLGETLFAGTQSLGVIRSVDNGITWTTISDGLPSNSGIDVMTVRGTSLFAGEHLGSGILYRLDNNATKWLTVKNGLPSFGRANALATLGPTVFAAVTNFTIGSSASQSLYSSADNGSSWQVVSGGPSGVFINSLAAGSTADNVQKLLAGTRQGAYRILGNSWVAIAGLPQGVYVQKVSAEGALTLIGTYRDGVFSVSGNSATATVTNNGLTNTSPADFAALGDDLFVATAGNGVYRTRDNGLTWQAVNNGLSNTVVTSLAVNGTTIFAGVPFIQFESGARGGVYRSLDGGANWTKAVSNGVTVIGAGQNQILAGTASDGFAGVQGGPMLRSTDNGVTWKAVDNFPILGITNAIESNGSTILVGFSADAAGLSKGGLARSSDNGATWAAITNGLPAETSVKPFAVGGTIFLAEAAGKVYRSTDNGTRWTPISNGLPPTITSVNFTASGATLFAFINQNIYFSTDSGSNWNLLSVLSTDRPIGAATALNGNLFGGVSGRGVQILTNTVQSWTNINGNLGNRFVNAVLTGNNKYFVGTLGSGISQSADQGRTWKEAGGLPPNANVQALAATDAYLLAGLVGGGVYRSNNDGASWGFSGLANQTVNALKVSGTNIVFAATENGVQRSSDQGASWQTAGLANQRVVSLAFGGARLLAGTYGDGIYASGDNGATWAQIGNSASGLANLNITALTPGADGTTLFAGTDGGGIYRSTNGGATWTPINNDLPPTLNIYSFAVSGNKLYAGSVYGIFLSEDNGVKWTQLNAGLLDIYVTSLVVSGKTLVAGTRIGGVFTSQIP